MIQTTNTKCFAATKPNFCGIFSVMLFPDEETREWMISWKASRGYELHAISTDEAKQLWDKAKAKDSGLSWQRDFAIGANGKARKLPCAYFTAEA